MVPMLQFLTLLFLFLVASGSRRTVAVPQALRLFRPSPQAALALSSLRTAPEPGAYRSPVPRANHGGHFSDLRVVGRVLQTTASSPADQRVERRYAEALGQGSRLAGPETKARQERSHITRFFWPSSPEAGDDASVGSEWSNKLASEAGLASGISWLQTLVGVDVVTAPTADQAAAALEGKLGVQWGAVRSENADAALEAAGFDWFKRMAMMAVSQSFKYASLNGITLQYVYTAGGLLSTEMDMELGGAPVESGTAGEYTEVYTSLGADGSILEVYYGYHSEEACSEGRVDFKKFVRNAFEGDRISSVSMVVPRPKGSNTGDDGPTGVVTSTTYYEAT